MVKQVVVEAYNGPLTGFVLSDESKSDIVDSLEALKKGMLPEGSDVSFLEIEQMRRDVLRGHNQDQENPLLGLFDDFVVRDENGDVYLPPSSRNQGESSDDILCVWFHCASKQEARNVNCMLNYHMKPETFLRHVTDTLKRQNPDQSEEALKDRALAYLDDYEIYNEGKEWCVRARYDSSRYLQHDMRILADNNVENIQNLVTDNSLVMLKAKRLEQSYQSRDR